VRDPICVVTRGSSYENRSNLAPAFFDQIIRKYEGTRLGRQELEAELLEDTPGALWSHASIEASRLRSAPEMTRVVVAIDPAVTSGDEADETGIVVAGKDKNGHGYVLTDISGRYPPTEWARLAITAYAAHRADRIVARSTTAATWSGRRFAWSTQTWHLPRSAPRAARSCGPNRWRRSISRAGSITSAPSHNSKTR
jgi:phage terminase large subunit-like protein